MQKILFLTINTLGLRRRSLLQAFLLVVLWGLGGSAHAQRQYPIQLSLIMNPPHSVYLEDYYQEGTTAFMVNMYVRDLDIKTHDIQFKLKIEGAGFTIESKPTWYFPRIPISGGEGRMFYGNELKQYFESRTLKFSGNFNAGKLRQIGRLPDGFYRFYIEVWDYDRKVRISNTAMQQVYLVLNKPPMLLSPKNFARLGKIPGQTALFTWHPQDRGSFTAFQTRYRFELFESPAPTTKEDYDSRRIISNGVKIMEEETDQLQFLLNPALYNLKDKTQYAWHVQAFDPMGQARFENNGYSVPRKFRWGIDCPQPFNIQIESTTESAKEFCDDCNLARVTWQVEGNVGNITNYYFENRIGQGFTMVERGDLYDKEFMAIEYPGTLHQMRLKSVCITNESEFTDWQNHKGKTYPKVPPSRTGECGDVPEPIPYKSWEVDNSVIQVGDTVQMGFTEFYIIKSIERKGDALSGKCLWWMPYHGVGLRMRYHNVKFNKYKQGWAGQLEWMPHPLVNIKAEEVSANLNEAIKAGAAVMKTIEEGKEVVLDVFDQVSPDDTIKYSKQLQTSFSEYYIDENSQLVGRIEGSEEVEVLATDLDQAEATAYRDKSGQSIVVGKNQRPMSPEVFLSTGGGSYRGIQKRIEQQDALLQTDSGKVVFQASRHMKYGFDQYDGKIKATAKDYQNIKPEKKEKEESNDSGAKPVEAYPVAWKSVAEYQVDKVSFESLGVAADKLSIRNDLGVPVVPQGKDLHLRGGMGGDQRALYAYRLNADSTETVVGKLNITTLSQKKHTIQLVAVNGAKLPDASTLETELNEIYKGAATSWKVEIAPSFKKNFPGGFEHGKTGWTTPYSPDQEDLIEAYDDKHILNDKDYYLFCLPNAKDKGYSVAGYMPLNYKAGFIYNNPDLSTYAHELAHGAFHLEHPFKEFPGVKEGSTCNLMDYSSCGNGLYKYQWDQIQNPKSDWMAFAQSKKEGERIIVNEFSFDEDDLKSYKIYLGKLIQNRLFKKVYSIADNHDDYISVESFKIKLSESKENLKRYNPNSNGSFRKQLENIDNYVLGIKFGQKIAGSADLPHKIVLYSSKNFSLTERSDIQWRGNGFKSSSTIFEEIYHASHFLYFKKNDLFNSRTFHSQTEAEVILGRALYYQLQNDPSLLNDYDSYFLIRSYPSGAINKVVVSALETILLNKELSDSSISLLKPVLIKAVERKISTGYNNLFIDKIDWNFDFLKYILKHENP